MQYTFQKPPTLNLDTSRTISRSRRTRVGGISQIPTSYEKDSDVQDNYSAYRLNTNVATSGLLSPQNSVKRIRKGFYGETYVLNDQPSLPGSMISPTNDRSHGSTTLRQSGNALVSPVRLRPIQETQRDPYHYNQFYNGLPGPLVHNQYQSNYILATNNNIPEPSLPSLHRSKTTIFDAVKEPKLARVEQLIENQSKHLHRILNSITLDQKTVEKAERQATGETDLAKLKISARDPETHVYKRHNNVVPKSFSQRKDLPSQEQSSLSHISSHILTNNSLFQIQSPKSQIPILNRQNSNKSLKSTSSLADLEGTPMNAKFPTSSPMLHIQEEDTPINTHRALQNDKMLIKENDVKRRVHVTFKEPVKVKLGLKQALWALVYSNLLSKEVNNKMKGLRKLSEQQNTSKQIQQYRDQVRGFIEKHCFTALKKLYKQSKNLALVNEDKEDPVEISKKDQQKRFQLITTSLTEILTAFKGGLTEESFPTGVLDFFAGMACKNGVIPHRFLTNFEASCLEFTHYGTLKNVTPMRIKLLIGMFVFVKGLLHVFLNDPWMFTKNVKETAILVTNLRSCSSVLYQITMDIFKQSLHSNKDNQQFIHPDYKIRTLKYPPQAYAYSDEDKKASGETLNTEVITGLYTKKDLMDCFVSQQESVTKLKSLVGECLDRLYKIVVDAQEKKEKQ